MAVHDHGESPGSRAGRPRSGEAKLSRDRILTAALHIVDEHGLAGLTMRKLGASLGVNPMSLYHHLAGRDAVIAGLVEMVYAEMQLPESTADASWPQRVEAWASAYRDLARAHPNLVLQIVADAAAVSRASMLGNEPLYQALDAAGLDPGDIVRAADTLVDFVHGFAVAEAAQPVTGTFDRSAFLADLDAQPEGAVPVMRRVYQALSEEDAAYDFDAAFTGGVHLLIAGIASRAGADGVD